jgi:hypothetical protein
MAGRSAASPYRHDLLKLDWRSPHEFFGYLVRILDGNISEDSALGGGYTDTERSWLRYMAALLADRKNNAPKAEKLLQPVVLETGRQNWIHFLALARLAQTQQHVLETIGDPELRQEYQTQIDQFTIRFKKSRQELAKRQAVLAELRAKLRQDGLTPETKRALLEKILETDSGDGNLLVELVFYCSMDEDWNQALEYARRFLRLDGRENAGRLRVGLLTAEILLNMNRKKEALAELETYLQNTQDAWYRLIAESLLDRQEEMSLPAKAGETPEYTLTGHLALAVWAEGLGDKHKAIGHYREALGSYMDDMIEYIFAVERIKRLRQKS